MTFQTAQGPTPTSLALERCRIEQNTRAGVATFGASVALGASIIDCNTLDLAGEEHEGRSFDLTDRGGNVCGCAGQTQPCQVLSTGLLPPDPL